MRHVSNTDVLHISCNELYYDSNCEFYRLFETSIMQLQLAQLTIELKDKLWLYIPLQKWCPYSGREES